MNDEGAKGKGTLHVVGGGLTGMAVAWEAAHRLRVQPADERIFDRIVLYERLDRFGGKAGSERAPVYDGDGKRVNPSLGSEGGTSRTLSDHGYHLFPTWYRNVIELMGEIGVDYDDIAVEGERFGKHPRGVNLAAARSRAQNANVRFKRAIGKRRWFVYDEPPPVEGTLFLQRGEKRRSMAAFMVTAADLVATRDAALERWTMHQYLRWHHPILRRWAVPVYDSLILKALSADTKKMSALAVAKMFRRWMTPVRSLWSASWSSLDGSLQAKFIVPLVDALDDLDVEGVEIEVRESQELREIEFCGDDPGRVRRLHFVTGASLAVESRDWVVLAVPADVLERVVPATNHEDLHRIARRFGEMTSVFSGLDVYFPGYIEVPREHFGFDSDDIATTAYDISSVWPEDNLELPERTVLQLVTPAIERTSIEDDGALVRYVVRELEGYFNVEYRDTRWLVHRNHEAKLSLANKEVYAVRSALNALDLHNLRIAGDFMKSSIGVPSMEAAVGNGRKVAAEIVGGEPKDPDEDVYPPWWYRILAWLLIPVRWTVRVVENILYAPVAAVRRVGTRVF